MTENEAKTKLCCGPPVLFALMGALKDGQQVNTTTCFASACMAWRWSEEKRIAACLEAVVTHMKATGDNFNKATQEVIKRRDEFAHTEGFCGLAGQP